MVVYDRSCRLHTYALLREPAFFKNTVFRVDTLHWRGHTACSEGYNPETFRRAGFESEASQVPHINSEAAEQCNSGLKFLRTACSFMTQEHFLRFTRTYLAFQNRKKIELLRAPVVASAGHSDSLAYDSQTIGVLA